MNEQMNNTHTDRPTSLASDQVKLEKLMKLNRVFAIMVNKRRGNKRFNSCCQEYCVCAKIEKNRIRVDRRPRAEKIISENERKRRF